MAGAVVSKPTAKKTTCRSGELLRESDGVERRVEHPHVAAAGLHREEVELGAGDAEHVAERGEGDLGAAGDGDGAVDQLERRDADGAARAVDERDELGEHPVEAVLDERVGLPAADLHEGPGAGDEGADRVGDLPDALLVPVLVDELHETSAFVGLSELSSSPISSSAAQMSFACSSSIFEIAKPTWTRT